MFELHPQLAKDCFILGDFPLCKLLMMNDYHYPWFILVPKQQSIREAYELSEDDQMQLTRESAFLSELIQKLFKAHKINVAALGNMVPQLHIHVIGRFDFDTAWPHPVWGRAQSNLYEKSQLLDRIELLKGGFQSNSKITFEWEEQWI